MILQISPVEKNVSESIFTLNFGQRGMSAELGAATKKMEDGKVSSHVSNRHSSLYYMYLCEGLGEQREKIQKLISRNVELHNQLDHGMTDF